MNTDEINKRIATEIMGVKCWHETYDAVYGVSANINADLCAHCCADIGKWWKPNAAPFNPDYCSDDSPRRLLNDVETKVIEKYGAEVYGITLGQVIQMPMPDDHFPLREIGIATAATATTLQRVTALLAAWNER